ncbi:MAG: hypothetical protein IPM21_05260 [Acidobacteria bacterium]|nr:hypothetical protein [Acidobacteriota bacterium]
MLAGDAAGLVSFELTFALLASFLSSESALVLSSSLLVLSEAGEAVGETAGLAVGAAVGVGVAEFGVVVVVVLPPQAPITKLIAATKVARNIGLLITLDLLSDSRFFAACLLPEKPPAGPAKSVRLRDFSFQYLSVFHGLAQVQDICTRSPGEIMNFKPRPIERAAESFLQEKVCSYFE